MTTLADSVAESLVFNADLAIAQAEWVFFYRDVQVQFAYQDYFPLPEPYNIARLYRFELNGEIRWVMYDITSARRVRVMK
jgi:hypothetical protein